MRKYIGLICSVLMLFSSIYGIYEINKPNSGAIGNGTISPVIWVLFISTTVGGIFLFSLNVVLIIKENKRNKDQ
ncbi:MAG: hypothetical protein Q8934_19970 [Bacillota bacterium]|nr:hypothetical protein [Bacillota bacterium]